MKNVEDIYPLSPMQTGMLFHCLAAPGDPVYFEQYLAQIDGELAVPEFQHAWASVIARHHVLRSAFVWEGLKEPMQVVRRHVALPWETLDWSDRPAAAHAAALDALLRTDRERPFALAHAPLMRLTLVRLASDRHALLWSFHHLLLDGWSCAVVQREVAERYAAALAGVGVRADPARPYADYIRWLRQQDPAGAERFWREELAGADPTPLPFEPAADPDRQPNESAELTLELSADATARIVQAARAQGLALNTVCQAAWALVLARYAGADEVLFGAIVSGRPAALPGVEQMVGLFINTLCVRVQLPRRVPVGAWLSRLQVEAAAAREHEHTPLADAQRWSGAGHATLFESVCVYESYPRAFGPDAPAIDVPLRVSPLRTVEKTNYPVTLVIIPGERLQLMLVVQRRRFAVDAMERVLAQFAHAIDALLDDPSRELQDVSLLQQGERARAVAGWNDPSVDAHAFVAVHESFERQVERTPNETAVACGGATLDYDQLNRRASRLARHLQAQGAGPDTIVGVCLERSIDLVVALLAVLKAGAAYAPLDPQYPHARLALALEDAGIAIVLTHTSLADRVSAGERRVIPVDRLDVAPAVEDDANVCAAVMPESLAYVIFTSGSTGRPKGVMIPHGALANHMRWMQRAFPLSKSDRVLQKTPFGFDASVWEFYAPLLAGATLVVAQPGVHQDPAALIDAVDRDAITILQVVPSMLRLLVDHDRFAACQSLRRVFVGGEPLTPELQTRFFERSHADLVNLYGPTEVTIDSVVWPCRRGDSRARVPIGVPVDHTAAYVLDDRGEPVPAGVSGELWLAGVQVARGYCGRPDLTAERFVPDPFSAVPGARAYRTGDLARYGADGACEFVGRADQQVKLHGYRIELGDIETALRAQPDMRDAVVLLREDMPGQAQLVAYVTGAAESASADVLQRALRTVLPDYMVPSAIVALDALPLTPNGKVDRAALPPPGAARRTRDYIPPRDAVELQLVRVWEELLQTRPVGVRDDFFESGGHSILVLHLVAHIERTFEVRVSLADLVQGTTVERLALMIREGRAAAESRLVLMQPGGSGVPLFAIVPAGGTLACYVPLAETMGQERPFYALQPRSSIEEAAAARTIELMAQADLEELRRVQPTGPYALIGWSMGGLIAYEMAALLREAGETVDLLALLDAGVPDLDQPQRDATELVAGLAAQHLDLDLREVDGLPAEARFEALLELARRQGKLAHEVDMRWVRWLADGFRISVEATQLYRPRPYEGSLVLIRAAEHESRGDDTMGWGALARGGVTVHWVPGAHYNIVHQPHVGAVADVLRACLGPADRPAMMAGTAADVA